jgi:4-carboxymuconolactone decarboxylase
MSARVDTLRPEQLSAEQRALYDRLVGGPRAKAPRSLPLTDEEGRLRGPFNAMLLSPEVGHALQELGAAVRFRTGFTPRQREIAILTVAAHECSTYEWRVHSHDGRNAGLTEEELAAIRDTAAHPFPDPAETAVLAATRELMATGDLTGQSYAEATQVLGDTGLFELLTLVGYYRLLACQLRVLRVTD